MTFALASRHIWDTIRAMVRFRTFSIPVFALFVACNGAKTPGGLPALDCTSEVSYQGMKTGGGVEILSIGNGKAHYEDVAIRQVNDQLANFVAVQTRLCRDYNAGVVTREEYSSAATKTREAFTSSVSAAEAYKAATTDGARKHALDALLRGAVPAEARVGELQLDLSLDADLPPSVGSGKNVVKPGAPLPTNARVAFTLRSSKEAYVYLFQKKPSGAVAVLFPDARAGAPNPLPAGSPVRIPQGSLRYRVTDEDLGVENVYIVASRSAIPALESAVTDVGAGRVRVASANAALASFATVAPGTPPAGCSRARALELEGPPPSCTRSRGLVLDEPGGASQASMVVRTDPGDDTIVKVFPFEHVSEIAYSAAQKTFEASDGVHGRGIVIEM